MPFSFPSNPTVGQTSTQNGRSYRYAGNNVWELAVSSGGSSDSRWDLFLPPAPSGLTATGGNAQVSLSWTAPTVLAQTPITDYVVQYSSNSGSTWTTFSDGTSTATSATVTGLTNGTEYVFRVAAVNGVGAGAPVTSGSVAPGNNDPLFSSVSLLLHFEGSSAVDSSSNNLQVTLSGATLSSDRAFAGSKSLAISAIEGDAGSASVGSSSAFAFGLADFVIEGWFYATSHVDSALLWSLGPWGSGPELWLMASSNGSLSLTTPGNDSNPCGSLPAGAWRHIAVARTSGTINVYNNGALVAQRTVTSWSGGNFSDNRSFFVGSSAQTGWLSSLQGNIDEFRITKGSNRGYTGATITVPNAPFPDA